MNFLLKIAFWICNIYIFDNNVSNKYNLMVDKRIYFYLCFIDFRSFSWILCYTILIDFKLFALKKFYDG